MQGRVSLVACLALAAGGGTASSQSVPRTEGVRTAAFPEPFSQVRGLRELSTGIVLVTDWTEERLVALDFAKGSVTGIGGVGGGPREYRLPAQLMPLPGDSTLLMDVGNVRLVVIGPDLAIHRTASAQLAGTPYAMGVRAVDTRGRLYFGVPPWSQGPDAPPGDSVDLARLSPGADAPTVLGRVQGAASTSWQREHKPRMTPGIPMVIFSPQDAWVATLDGRVAIVRSGDYHVEWQDAGGARRVGKSYAYPQLAVTDADKRAFVIAFTKSSPMSGKGPDGTMGHTPAEFLSPERIAEDLRTNEFAERHPYFRPGGVWLTLDGQLLVERSVPAGAAPVLDVFDGTGTLVRQVVLPAGRRVVGAGRGTVYAVIANDDDLETLERYALAAP